MLVWQPTVAETLQDGQKLDQLVTKSGKTYDNVRIREVLEDRVRIMHRDGVATLPARDLPQYSDSFVASAEEVVAPDEAPPSAVEVPKWEPETIDDVVACCLLVNIEQTLSETGQVGAGAGSAFLCNLNGQTYIYSNVHNFHGAGRFTIVDGEGTEYSDFESVEVAAEGEGVWKEMGWGGDILRIRLREYRPRALSIDPLAVSRDESVGKPIIVTGNEGGEGEITRLEGVISEVDENGIIYHTAAAEPGNSGSPIVNLETMKVIGILTWGVSRPDNPLEDVWSKSPDEEREVKAGGAGLAGVRFERSSFKDLLRERVWLNQLKKNIRLIGLMDALVPTKQGIFVNRDQSVMGDYTVADVLAESKGHAVIRELSSLDRWLKEHAGSNIGISNQDMLKRYIPVYRRCLGFISRQSSESRSAGDFSFYTQCSLRNTRSVEICAAYQRSMRRTIDWYVAQRGTRGKALPVAARYRLPSFKSGLRGLGLQRE